MTTLNIPVKIKRGLRSALNSLQSSSGLIAYTLYLLSDESRLAVATATNAYTAFAKQSEGVPTGGSTGQVLTKNSGTDLDVSWKTASAGASAWVVKTAAYTATAGDQLLCDTTAGAFTVTLPASATTGATIELADAAANFGTANLTVARNGLTIDGASANLVMSVSRMAVKLVYTGSTWAVALVNRPPKLETFTSSGTWTKDFDAKAVYVICIGGGGGGSSGQSGPSGTTRNGGAGGPGPGISTKTFLATDLSSTVSVTVGSGGAGGAGSANNTNGTLGSAGNQTTFGTLMYAGGGQPNSVTSQGSGGPGTFVGNNSNGGTQYSNQTALQSGGGPAGASGCGVGPSPSSNVGSQGAISVGWSDTYTRATGGGSNGAAGGNGVNPSTWGSCGTAGASGGTDGTTTAGNGGNGGYGAGGGGGSGLASSTASSGSGGNGGNGIVYIMTLF